MPRRYVSWRCDRCNRRHHSYDEANRCEHDHIVKDAIDGFRADLERIFADIKDPTNADT